MIDGKGCGACYFKKTRFVGGRGNINAPLLIIGESPSMEDLTSGQAFSKASGAGLVLQKELDRAGLTPNDYYITSATECLPVRFKSADINKKESAAAVSVCRNRLLKIVEAAPRKVILCLGNAAFWGVSNQSGSKVTQNRGRVFTSSLASIGILSTLHPTYLLRGGGGFTQKFRDDVKYAIDLTKGRPVKHWDPPEYLIADTEDDVREIRYRLALDHDLHVKELMDRGIARPYARPEMAGRILVASDIETSGFRHRDDDMLCSGVSAHPKQTYIIPEDLMNSAATRELYSDRSIFWIWHNGKFDVKFLRHSGADAVVDGDTMLGSYVQNENRGMHDLDQVAADTLGAIPHKDMLQQYLPNKKTSFRAVPRKLLHKYLAYDVSKTRAIFDDQHWAIENDDADRLAYNALYIPASEMLTDVEMHGIEVNVEQVTINAANARKEMREILRDLNALTMAKFGKTYNPGSPLQMKELLYTNLGLGLPSDATDEDTLIRLPKVPEVKLLMAYRKVAKKYGTYIRPLLTPEQLTPEELKKYSKKSIKNYLGDYGRVYATFLIHGTKTGRLSSRDPNMQNQPREGYMRDMFRAYTFKSLDAYIAWLRWFANRYQVELIFDFDEIIVNADGSVTCWMYEVDYNQAELRSLAYMSQDPELMRIYTNPNAMSLHYEVSVDLWGESWLERYTEAHKKADPVDYDIAKGQYIRTKAVNFGIVYGRTAFDIADEFEIPVSEAEAMLSGWARKFSKAWEFIQKCRDAPTRGITMKTVYGRRKRATYAAKENMTSLQNEAANFPHQSTASDFTLESAIILQPKLRVYASPITNLIHDAIYGVIPPIPRIAKDVCALIVKDMEATPVNKGIVGLPFTAEPEIGFSWGSLKKESSWDKWFAEQMQPQIKVDA